MLIAADMVAARRPTRIAAGRGSETMRVSGSRSVLGLIHFDPQRRAVFLASGDKTGNGQIGVRRLFRKPSKPMRSIRVMRRRSEQASIEQPERALLGRPG